METLTREQIQSGHGFASIGLREEVLENLKENESALTFSYTDYGGDFFDKVCCQYFKENLKDGVFYELTNWFGMNLYVTNQQVVKDFNAATENYLLGYNDLESFFYEMESNEFDEFVNFVVSDCLLGYNFDKETVENWLYENKQGYYNTTTQGVDFSERTLLDEMTEANIITK